MAWPHILLKKQSNKKIKIGGTGGDKFLQTDSHHDQIISCICGKQYSGGLHEKGGLGNFCEL